MTTRHIDYGFYTTPVGKVLLATHNEQLCWLSIDTDITVLQQHYAQNNVALRHNPSAAAHYKNALDHYFSTGQLLSVPLAPQGTSWQQQVWQALQQIPSGSTISYSQLAQQCGRPTAVRAAASACARNPVALFIPCHRVLTKSGSLGGYRWGVEHKQWLIAMEKEKALC